MSFIPQSQPLPTNLTRHITLEEYHPDSFPSSCPKPFIHPDSITLINNTSYPVFGRFSPHDISTDTLYQGVAPDLIKVRRMDDDSSFSFSNGIFIFLILMLFVVAWIRVFYSKVFTGLSKAVFYYQWAGKLFDEKNSVSQRVMNVLDLIFLINASLAIYYLMKHYIYTPGVSDIELLLSSTAISLFIYFVRFAGIGLIALLTKQIKIAEEFLSLTGVYHKAGGVILFIPLLAFNYIPENMIQGLSIFTLLILVLSFILPIYRGLSFAIKTKFLFFYYFLYFCAVEILPLMLTIKYFGLTSGFFPQN